MRNSGYLFVGPILVIRLLSPALGSLSWTQIGFLISSSVLLLSGASEDPRAQNLRRDSLSRWSRSKLDTWLPSSLAGTSHWWNPTGNQRARESGPQRSAFQGTEQRTNLQEPSGKHPNSQHNCFKENWYKLSLATWPNSNRWKFSLSSWKLLKCYAFQKPFLRSHLSILLSTFIYHELLCICFLLLLYKLSQT